MSSTSAPVQTGLGEPSVAEVEELAALDWLEVSGEEARELQPSVANLLATIEELMTVPDLDGPDPGERTRGPGRRPVDGEDPFNAFTTLCEVHGAPAGPLAGRRVGIKDNIDIAGIPTTNASPTDPYTPSVDAVVVERILEAGGMIVGKLNMDDYASGATGETSAFGPPLNPLDPRRSAGGSSGGSGSALASGAVDLALGGDQGGSARIPASYCGVVALKATHGLIPSHGMTHLGHTIDYVCPMARTVGEVGLLLEVLAGEDARDPQWVRGSIPPSTGSYLEGLLSIQARGIRIAIVEESLGEDLCEPAVVNNLGRTADQLREAGATVERMSLPLWRYGAKLTQTLLCHLVGTMIRTEGEGRDHLGLISTDRMRAFARKRRIQAGLFPPYIKAWLIADRYLYDRHEGTPYGKLHNGRLAIRRAVDQALASYDVLLTPTTPTTAPELLATADPTALVNRVLGSAPYNTATLNLSGHPALALPNGVAPNGMPTSVQVIGRRFDEARVLQLGRLIESENEATGGKAQ